MGHKKSIGLPGGPNEFLQDITQYISIEGYKNDSPDKNNPVNIIESSNITMEGVDFPVRGYGNNGMVQDMIPGVENYDYGNADYVVEVPKAQYGNKETKGSSYKEILRNTEKSFNKWLDYSMGPINNIGQILTEDQMKKFYDFDDNIENQVANIRQEYKDENIPYGSKNWKPVNMDPRIIALRKEQADWEAANPIYQETRDLINEGLDPLRHSSSSAKTSKALQQKVRDVPYIGGLLDFLGVDKAVGFVGANALGIGHEAMTLPDDKRDWKTKLKESGQDIYNNFKGSLEGNKNLNERETLNNLLDQYKLGNLADGTVMQEGGCTSCTESMRQREGSYNKGKEYILDPRFKQEGGSTTNPYTIYMNYINGIDESEVAQNIFDKLNRMHYKDAKEQGMGVANYIATNVISVS